VAVLAVDTGPPCYMPPLWSARHRSPGSAPSGQDQGYAIALDASGNIFAAGYGSNWTTNRVTHYQVVKYDPHGNQAWITQYESGNAGFATAIAVDASGNAYVTGFTHRYSVTNNQVIHDDEDYATLKLDGSGNLLWVARFDSSTATFVDERAYGIAVDKTGNVYVAGDHGTLKYDSNGVALWTNAARGDFLKLSFDGNFVSVASLPRFPLRLPPSLLW
jgi:hypothetical protein